MIERIESKFKYGDIVTPISGAYKGETGVVYKKPTKENGYHYTIITEDKPYGYWATDDELVMQFTEAADKKDIRAFLDKVYAVKLRNEEYDKYIREDVDPYIFYSEMSDVCPGYNKKHGTDFRFKVFIYPNDGPIPHVHVVFKDGRESYVKLLSAEYLDGHQRKNYEMNRSERNDLVTYFTTISKTKEGGASNIWNDALDLWWNNIKFDETKVKAFNDLAQKDEKGNIIMPDYSNIADPKSNKLTADEIFG